LRVDEREGSAQEGGEERGATLQGFLQNPKDHVNEAGFEWEKKGGTGAEGENKYKETIKRLGQGGITFESHS